jgi:hypothetical protein
VVVVFPCTLFVTCNLDCSLYAGDCLLFGAVGGCVPLHTVSNLKCVQLSYAVSLFCLDCELAGLLL